MNVQVCAQQREGLTSLKHFKVNAPPEAFRVEQNTVVQHKLHLRPEKKKACRRRVNFLVKIMQQLLVQINSSNAMGKVIIAKEIMLPCKNKMATHDNCLLTAGVEDSTN